MAACVTATVNNWTETLALHVVRFRPIDGRMGATMLIEIWEHLRGYDKWVEAEATIESAQLIDRLTRRPKPPWWRWLSYVDLLVNPWQANCAIAWTDAGGARYLGSYAVCEKDPLFQKYEGQRVSIRYNPANPEQYYLLEGASRRALFSLLNWAFFSYMLIVCVLLAFNLVRTLDHRFRR